MRKILLSFPLYTIIACTSNEITPGDAYIKYFGGNGTFELKDMILRGDGNEGVLMLGIQQDKEDDGIVRRDGYIVETDKNGSLLRDISLPLTDANGNKEPYSFEASRIAAISGGYLVIGSNSNQFSGSIAAWSQLDTNLKMVGGWHFVGDSIHNYYGVDINSTSDGGVLVAGYTDVNGDNDFFYTKIGGTTTGWTRVQTRTHSDDRLIRALPTSSGDFALFGRTDALSQAGERGINVERSLIDQRGIIINSLIYGTSVGRENTLDNNIDDIPYDVIEKPGGFAVVGDAFNGTDSYPFIMNVDLTGAVTNTVNFETDFTALGFTGRAFGVTQSLFNDFILVGELIDFEEPTKDGKAKNNELMVMKTDQSGALVGDVKNFGVENDDDKAVRVLATPDGSLLVGATFDFGGGLTEFALLKMNIDGELKQ